MTSNDHVATTPLDVGHDTITLPATAGNHDDQDMADIELATSMPMEIGPETLDPPASPVVEENESPPSSPLSLVRIESPSPSPSRLRPHLRSFSFSDAEKLNRRRELEGVEYLDCMISDEINSNMLIPASAQHNIEDAYLFGRSQSDKVSYRQARREVVFSIVDGARRPSERQLRYGRNHSMPADFDHVDSPLNYEMNQDQDDDDLIPLTQPVEGLFRSPRLSSPSSIGLRLDTTIKSTLTGATDDSDNEVSKPNVTPTGTSQQQQLHRRKTLRKDGKGPGNETTGNNRQLSWKTLQLPYVMYLSVFSIFGSILRVYLARFFGGDCEDHSITDFWTPLSRHVCVTANGRTMQTGGALFLDLPANMLGSFVMGVITPPDQAHSLRLPWLRKSNPLQEDDVLHAAFSVGFCGSLTTFASWNNQMVVMMVRNYGIPRVYPCSQSLALTSLTLHFDVLTSFSIKDGTHTELGSQIISAMFGYLLGMVSATASFKYGRQLSSWLQNWRNPMEIGPVCSDDAMDIEEGDSNPAPDHSCSESSALNRSSHDRRFSIYTSAVSVCRPKNSIFILVIGLLAAFLVADALFGIRFYRKMFLLSLLSPAGALLRWNLAYYNIPNQGRIGGTRLDWVPWGTLAANLLGATISIVCVGIGDHFAYNVREDHEWLILILGALATGFAGSLSTVSSMVKEIVLLSEKYPGHAKPYQYAGVTLGVSLLFSLIFYYMLARDTW
jgi:fluoride exporter